MRYFVVMEVVPDRHSNGYVPAGPTKGDVWISSGRVISEEQLAERLQKIKASERVDLNILIK